ncbi:MAG: endo-1,4-beta-xylanase [Gemmataceae bacterium]
MGTMNLLLPSGASPGALADLGRACIAGGYDNMPTPTRAVVQGDRLMLSRDVDESGYLVVPWEIPGAGRLMGTSATLIERPTPFQFAVEIARGKVNQLRNQMSDWRAAGLQIAPELDGLARTAGQLFGRAVTHTGTPPSDVDALAALGQGYQAATALVRTYVDQIFRARHQRQPKLDTALGVRLNGPVSPAVNDAVVGAFNTIGLPLIWRQTEPTVSNYRWDEADSLLMWASERNVRATAGPLIDFSTFGLPEWLWQWEGDLPSLSSYMCDYVETAVGRYHKQVRRWQLTAGSNNANLLKLSEDDLLWLTARLAEAAWQVDSELELVIGIAQPWGEYMAREEHTYSPFVFADTLIRAGLKLAALDLEWVMGVTPRGSYCRDLLEASRILDVYALLGTPLQVTLAYPSARVPDPLADPALAPMGGHWLAGHSPEVQAEWAADFTALASGKPFVRGVQWTHLSDATYHQFPHCGLLDAAGAPKPALARIKQLRDEHFR